MPKPHPLDDAMAWIDSHLIESKPTEILVPLVYGIGPVWMYQEKRGAWFSFVDAAIDTSDLENAGIDTGLLGRIGECQHGHESRDEAWTCAEAIARLIAVGVLNDR